MTTETTPQERLSTAQATADSLRKSIGEKVGAGESFDVEAVQLAAAVATASGLLKDVNSGALADETTQMATTIDTLQQASKLADLMGEPVTSIYWSITPGDGENGPIMNCAINVKARIPSTRSTSSSGSGRGGSKKTPTFKVDGGDAMSATDFVVNHAPEEVQNLSLVKPDADGKRKWVTKPVHLDAVEKHLVEAGHTVERIAAE